MSKYLLIIILMAILVSPVVFAQEPFEESGDGYEQHERMLEEREHMLEEREHMLAEHEAGRHEVTPEEEMERQIHMRNMEMELNEQRALAETGEQMRQLELKKQHMALQQHEAQMDFNNKMREIELEKQRAALKQHPKKHHYCSIHGEKENMFGLVVVICFVVNILVAVWVYQDLRRRNAGSGIWIVIALLAGLFGALVYAVVRLGDSRQTQ